MGAKQAKEPSGSGSGWSPSHGWKRASRSGENRDILTSWLKSGAPPPPYQRRISMIQEMMLMAKQGKHDEATEMLKILRQDLGMESTSLDDVLYRYASFRNLVDPITHDLLISLARYVHCPRTEGDSLSSMEKVCRQLTYHLSPHSQWRRHGLLKRKPQACLKAVLSAPPPGGSLDLSGIPLAVRDMERLIGHLRSHAPTLLSLEMGFTELTDDAFLLLLPTLTALPRLETLALNGNRLTRAVLKELTDALKDPGLFPSVTWIDLGNNVDIFSLPQPFLVSLRKRCPRAQGNLPTILEFGESQASDPPGPPLPPRGTGDEDTEEETDVEDSNMTVSMGELRSEEEVEMDGEMEIEEMMEELLDFDREVQGVGGEELEDSLDFITHNASVQRVEGEELEDSMWASMEEGGGARRRRRDSCSSSQSRRSSAGAVEPMRVEEDEVEETSRPMTTEQLT